MRGTKPKLEAIAGGLADIPQAPAWLPIDAKDEWNRVAPGLAERQTLTPQDMGVLESYCLAAGMIRSSQKLIAAEGEMVENARGEMKRHPAYQTLFQSLTESRRLAAELGLTPASRNKATPAKADDDLAGFDL